MTHGTVAVHERPAIRGALEVLAAFTDAARLTFDSGQARRILHESERAISGEGPSAWAHRLVEVGESLNLRIRSLEAPYHDIFPFLQLGIPVAHCQADPDHGVTWTILLERKGKKIRLLDPVSGQERLVPPRQLTRELSLSDKKARCRWVIGQAALDCQAPGRSTDVPSSQGHLSPFMRLVGLLAPERKDLWVVLMFSAIVGILALATPIAVEVLVNTVAFGRYLQPIVVLALILFTFLAFAGALRGLIVYVAELLQRRLFIRVVEDLAYRLPRVQQEEYDSRHGPELVNRFFDVVTVQKAISSLLLDGLAIILQTLVGMTVLAFYHPWLLGFDIFLLALISLAVFGLGRGAIKTAIKESKAKYAVASWLEELARHPTAFKLHGGQQFALEQADQLAVDWLAMRRSHFHIVIRQILFVLALQAIAATVLLGLGGWLVISGELTLGQLVAAELIVMMIVGSFTKLGKHLENFYDLLASVDKLGALFDLATEPHDKLFHLREGEPATVKLEGVSCSIEGHPVLQNLSLTLAAGRSTAILGGPGSGKTTCVDLLCGLRTPSKGLFTLDGIDVRQLRPDSLRDHLAAARGIEVFRGTIDQNVHLNRANISAEDVRDALEVVGLREELQKLPQGLGTLLQTNGAPLSSSQASRLMIARAIVGRPRFLLIDGTLDALPDETALALLARLTQENRPWTLCLATGKAAIARECEFIYCLETGQWLSTPSESLCRDERL